MHLRKGCSINVWDLVSCLKKSLEYVATKATISLILNSGIVPEFITCDSMLPSSAAPSWPSHLHIKLTTKTRDPHYRHQIGS